MAQLEPGKGYLLQAGITNQSTRLGVGVAARLQVVPSGEITGYRAILFSPSSTVLDFLAGQALTPSFAFSTQTGDAGRSGVLVLAVRDPQGFTLAQAQEPIAVSVPALVSFYAAIRNLPTAFGWTKWQPLWSRGLSPADPNWDVWEPGSPGPISESERGRFVNYPPRGWYGWKYYNPATGQWSGLYTPYFGEPEGILTVWEGATVWGDASTLAVWIE